MKKTLLYRWFKLGAIPQAVFPVVEAEGLVLSDEGLKGAMIFRNVRGPGKRFLNRKVWFSGSLVITRDRVLAYTYKRCQINVKRTDSRISRIELFLPAPCVLALRFESSLFNPQWSGLFELRFKTERAADFFKALRSVGMSELKES